VNPDIHCRFWPQLGLTAKSRPVSIPQGLIRCVKHKGFRSGSEARINGMDKFRCLTINVKRRGARRLVRLDPAAAESAARGARSSLGVAPAQPESELDARKNKKNQGKSLAFPWIPLAESGLFKGLRRIQVKKSGAL
jgi:hypothetical protein